MSQTYLMQVVNLVSIATKFYKLKAKIFLDNNFLYLSNFHRFFFTFYWPLNNVWIIH